MSEIITALENYHNSHRSKVFNRVLRDYTPRFVGPLVRQFVGPSVHHTTFLGFCGLWPPALVIK